MTFGRAFIVAMMTSLLMRSDGGIVAHLIVTAAGGVLWLINPDPLPDAIDKGLERFARRHRR